MSVMTLPMVGPPVLLRNGGGVLTRFYVASRALARRREYRQAGSLGCVEGLEQERLGHQRVSERVHVQGFVRAVSPRMGILHPGHEDLRARELAYKVGDEGNRSA